MAYHDAGLAEDHWKRFFAPDEVEEIVAAASIDRGFHSSGAVPLFR